MQVPDSLGHLPDDLQFLPTGERTQSQRIPFQTNPHNNASAQNTAAREFEGFLELREMLANARTSVMEKTTARLNCTSEPRGPSREIKRCL
jgi:hypothetical protein